VGEALAGNNTLAAFLPVYYEKDYMIYHTLALFNVHFIIRNVSMYSSFEIMLDMPCTDNNRQIR